MIDKVVLGTPDNDLIVLDDGSYSVQAGLGDDLILAGDGNSVINAGDGSHRITVGNGDNTVVAGDGNDRVILGNGANSLRDLGGDNTILVGAGTNDIFTGTGNDRIVATGGGNVIDAGGGDNRIGVAGPENQISAGAGDDSLNVEGDRQIVDLGDGQNRIAITGSNNRIDTGDGSDRITISGGNNIVAAGNGDNQIIVGDGEQYIESGIGDDRITFDDGAVTIVDGGGDNRITGGNGQVTIYASDGNNTIRHGDGTAELNIGDGDNRITLGNGEARIFAGVGNHTIRIGDGDTSMYLRAGNHRMTLGDGAAEITVEQGSHTLRKGDGHLSYLATGGTSTIRAGDGDEFSESDIQTAEGDDVILVGNWDFAIRSGAGRDNVRAGNGNNHIETGNGADLVFTGDGDNFVFAGDGDDRVRTGEGQDSISGGAGDDRLDGGEGEDTAVYAGRRSDYAIEVNANGWTTVASLEPELLDAGTDSLRNIEYLFFSETGTRIRIADIGTLELNDDVVDASDQGVILITVADLQSNDVTESGMALSVDAFSAAGASLSLDGDIVTYNQNDVWRHLQDGETATDTFTYTAHDGSGAGASGTVTVTIFGEDDPTRAQDDRLVGEPGAPNSYFETDEIALHATTASSSAEPASAALGDAGFATVWVGASDGGHNALRLSLTSADGAMLTRDIALADGGVITIAPDIAVAKDGTLAVVWGYRDLAAGIDETRMQFFDSNGTAKSEIVAIGDVNALSEAEVTALDNGSVLVTWRTAPTVPDGFNLVGAIYDSSGNAVVTEFPLHDVPAGTQITADAASLMEGFVVAFKNESAIVVRLFDSDGNAVSDEIVVPHPADSIAHFPQVFSDPDGGFGLLWFEQKTTNGVFQSRQVVQFFDTNGQANSDVIQITQGKPFAVPAEAVWLSDGRFVVAWTEGTTRDVNVKARIFDADGTPLADEFFVDTGLAGHQKKPDILALSDGRFAITWGDETEQFSAKYGIKARIYTPEGGSVEQPFVTENEVITIDAATFLANDLDPDSFDLSIHAVASESDFGATIFFDVETQVLHYDPTSAPTLQALTTGQIVEDHFTYTVTNEHGDVQTAEVSILVGGLDLG